MEDKKNIIWLASYPKSGNTWFRSFLTALKNNGEVHINDLKTTGIFSSKVSFEENLDIDADEISHELVDRFKRFSWQFQSNRSLEKIFIKIHDSYSISKFDCFPLIPEESTFAAIYFFINPLDVAISMANHNGQPIEYVISNILVNPQTTIAKSRKYLIGQFPQFIGSWNMHIESWRNLPTFPVHFVRYEDMKESPLKTFSSILKQIDYEATDDQIKSALEASKFEKLKIQEDEFGFIEKPKKSKAFFNKGEVGQWKSQLTKLQINTIKQFNEPMMRAFGYWEE